MQCNFHIRKECSHEQHGLCTHKIMTPCGIGTHIDAPYHFDDKGCDISQIPLAQLIAPAIVINWPAPHKDAQYTLEDLKNFEIKHGKIAANTIVLFNTHWSQHWHDARSYRGIDDTGRMHFPTIHPDVAIALTDRQVLGIGIDTLSPDPDDDQFPLHHFWLKQNKIIIENLTNLDQLPTFGAVLCALPIKIASSGEAPARVVAFVTR